ncbi:MAG: sulfurtransferase [Bacteroidales bacterium]|nr:sulfurtransferase [Bacteroidales bacterium]
MSQKISLITTKELIKFNQNEKGVLIDARPVDAYNGWSLQGELRGGHIKGAKSLPYKWTKYIDWIEIVRSKGILPENRIVIYSYSSKETELVAQLFFRAGYHNVAIYNHFIDEWTVNPELPMENLERYAHLVYPEWVKSISSGANSPNYNGNKVIICHAHYRNRDAYLSGHIPGAIDIDTLALESPETWNRRSPEELQEALQQHGITCDTTVVLYGKFMAPNNDDPFPGSAAGHIGAIRCAFIMMYAGVKDVRVLNGGFQSWIDAGYKISTEDVPKKHVNDFMAEIPTKPELVVDIPEAKELLKSRDGELICVRSWPEFIGEVSGYNYIEKKGRIPGAIFGNCGTDAYHMENYRNLDHTTREYHEIESVWKEAGITPDKHLAFYCGTGWRGSEAFFNAWLLGWPRVSVFDGGWFEWSNDPKNPFETGIPLDINTLATNN